MIDILHPAHVHFFRNFHREMVERGHEIFVTARLKECSVELLKRYSLPHRILSTQQAGIVGLTREMASRTSKLRQVVRELRPDVLTGIMGPSIAIAGRLSRVPVVVFYDTEFARQTNWFVYPLAHSVVTPDCYQGRVRGHHVTYPGYHELAYLHPRRFTPDPELLRCFGVGEEEPFSIVRFVSWQASHDRREVGLTADRKAELVELLAHHGRVLISSEGPLPGHLKPLRLSGPVEHIHHLLAHARIIVGESATMTSEAAVLGVPAVFIASTGRGYTDDQERRYGHVRYFPVERYDEALKAVLGFLRSGDGEMGSRARTRLLEDKIDVTRWMVKYFEYTFNDSSVDAGSERRRSILGVG